VLNHPVSLMALEVTSMLILSAVFLIFPGFISAILLFKIKRTKPAPVSLLVYAAIFSFLITALNYLVLWLRGYIEFDFAESLLYPQSVIKYAGLSLLFAVLLPYACNLADIIYVELLKRKSSDS
jgi:hypothetical protein